MKSNMTRLARLKNILRGYGSVVVAYSGGLDSTLAARIVRDQGIALHAIHFTSPFCTCAHKTPGNGGGCRSAAQTNKNRLRKER